MREILSIFGVKSEQAENKSILATRELRLTRMGNALGQSRGIPLLEAAAGPSVKAVASTNGTGRNWVLVLIMCSLGADWNAA